MELSEAKRLKAMEDENRRLKQIVADQTLDIQELKAVLTKKVLKPRAKKSAALFMIERFGLPQRRASFLSGVSTVFSYAPRSSELNDRIRHRMKELAEKHRRYGHWRLYVVLKREGFCVNHKRTERIYRSEGLSLRIRKRKKLASVARVLPSEATRPNQTLAMDFVEECLNENYFVSLKEAKELIENWRIEYNTYRPHSSLNDLTPEEFARRHKTKTPELYLTVA